MILELVSYIHSAKDLFKDAQAETNEQQRFGIWILFVLL